MTRLEACAILAAYVVLGVAIAGILLLAIWGGGHDGQ